MNENLDLTKILKDCPKGEKFYSMVDGEVEFDSIDKDYCNFIDNNANFPSFYKDGKAYQDRGECVLFPSKEQHDWSKFIPTWEAKKEVVKVTLHPFDKVLARTNELAKWRATLITEFSNTDEIPYLCELIWYKYCIPYNKDTAHLLGTIGECPIDYEIEFNKEFKE